VFKVQLQEKAIGFAFTGSHCTLARVLPQVQVLIDRGAQVIPILSPSVASTDTRFGEARLFREELVRLTGKQPIETIVAAEPIGPQNILDLLIIAPCTGNTLAKLATGITDTAVLMAAKAQVRNERPVVVAVSTNDALGTNAKNLGALLTMRHFYFVPFGQDDPASKRTSLVAHMELIPETIEEALEGRQLQPILREYR